MSDGSHLIALDFDTVDLSQSQSNPRLEKLQCGGPAMKGKIKCHFHGGRSTGPRTELGRQICAAAKTVHGKETRIDRELTRLQAMRIRLYAKIIGVALRSDAGFKRPRTLRLTMT